MGDSRPSFDKALVSGVGKHFELPPIRRVPAGRPFAWLAQGFRDMRGNLVESLTYGVVLAAIGRAILTYTAGRPQQFTASVPDSSCSRRCSLRVCTRSAAATSSEWTPVLA